MKKYYECHITMIDKVGPAQHAVEKVGWKFSAIDGDPDLGDGVKCYATKHFNTRKTEVGVIEELERIAKRLEAFGAMVVRMKVELVIYDVRKK